MKKEIYIYRKTIFLLTVVNLIFVCLTLWYLILDFYFPFPYGHVYLYDTGIFFYKINIVTVLFQYAYISIKESIDEEKNALSQKILDYIV